jgi:uncharacterized protein (TIGR02145 family)
MNHSAKIPGIIIFLISFTLCHTSCKDKPTLPVVTTTIVTGTTQISATSGGNVTNDGNAEVTSRGVCWNSSENPTIANSKTSDGTGTGSYTSSLTPLTPGTTYYVKAYATNSEGTAYGSQVSFSSNPVILATLTTTTASSITTTTAVSGGNITSDGGGAITARGVCWSKSQNPTTADSKTTDGSGTGSFTSNITGLSATSTYYLRAYAINSSGTAYGSQISFTTTGYLANLKTGSTAHLTQSSVTIYCEITWDGGASITSRGVCYSTSQNPTIADSKTNDGSGTGAFWSNLTGLIAGSTYYVRAYATNSVGTAYTDQLSIKTLSGGSIVFNPSLTYGSITDIDGNTYKTIQIGTQTWMAENLRTTKLNDSQIIPLVSDNVEWNNLPSPGYCWYYNDAATYRNAFGAMYNWFTVKTAKICPVGWHVPSATEWQSLMTFLGANIAANKLKEAGINHWESPNDATNETGFTALPGGERLRDGKFIAIGERGHWWSSNGDWQYGYEWSIWEHYDMQQYYYPESGISIRCIKD